MLQSYVMSLQSSDVIILSLNAMAGQKLDLSLLFFLVLATLNAVIF